jgi:peptide deformylase
MANHQPQILSLYYDGNAILHEKCRLLTKDEISSSEIQNLIDDIKYTCDKKKYGVGLSANQVGKPLAISVVAIKPTPSRPNLKSLDQVCINTEIIEAFGEKELLWEGCQSDKLDQNSEPYMAQVPRYTKIRVKYLDRNCNTHDEITEGFLAHVIQHETDHLNGVLYTDLIDKKNRFTNQEYRDKIAGKRIPPCAKLLLKNPDGKYLLLYRSETHPRYPHAPDLPGGEIEDGESGAVAMSRELAEEAGIEIAADQMKLIYEWQYIRTDDKGHKRVQHRELYECDLSKMPEPVISWEHEKYAWVSKRELIDELTTKMPNTFYDDIVKFLK